MRKKPAIRPKLAFLGKEGASIIDNVAMLSSAGAPLAASLASLADDIVSPRLKKILRKMSEEIDAGGTFYDAVREARIVSPAYVALIKNGEESGQLSENLLIISKQQQKDQVFGSHLKSAMLYPAIVMTIALFVGIGVTWFILPRIVEVFSGFDAELPLPTRVLLQFGEIIREGGLPLLLGIIGAMAMAVIGLSVVPMLRKFVYRVLANLPAIRTLVKEVEVARMGYVMSSLLSAGMPVNEALSSMITSTSDGRYKKLYRELAEGIDEGRSIQDVFATSKLRKKLLPSHLVSLIQAGEQSGKLEESFSQIASSYEDKIETTSKNLSVVLESFLLIVVWLVVATLALAIVLPIYSLVSNF